MTGRADYLDLGTWNVACAECGRKFKASEMRQLPPGVPGGGMWVCEKHWTPRQPQDYVRGVPDRMAVPYTQQQVDGFPLTVENVTDSADSVTIEIGAISASADAFILNIQIAEDGTIPVIGDVIITVTGDAADPTVSGVVINNQGVINRITNSDGVTVTTQGSGVVQVYTKGYFKLTTLGLSTPGNAGPLYNQTAFNSLLQVTQSSGTATSLYSFSAGGQPVSTVTGISPAVILTGRYGQIGDALFLNSAGPSRTLSRYDFSGNLQELPLGSLTTYNLDSGGAWFDSDSQRLFWSNSGALVVLSDISFELEEFTNSSSDYTPPYSLTVASNACLLPGRCYVYGSTSLGYFNTTSGAYTNLATYGVGGFQQPMVFADTITGSNPRVVVQRATSGQGNIVDIFNAHTNAIAGSVTLPDEDPNVYTNLNNWVYDYINGYIWCRNTSSARRLYALNMSDFTIADTYSDSDLPSSGTLYPTVPWGYSGGGIMAIHESAGVSSVYRIGGVRP